MGRPNAWKKTTRMCDAPKAKRAFKKALHRRNRRKAHLNPLAADRKLDAWAFD
jgi:hypothetical protein